MSADWIGYRRYSGPSSPTWPPSSRLAPRRDGASGPAGPPTPTTHSLQHSCGACLSAPLAPSAVSFALRVQGGFVTLDAITIGAAMIVGSLMGAYAGSVLSHRLSERRLKAVIALILSLVVARLVLDLLGGVSFSFGSIPSILELPMAAFFGLLVGVISGAVGVAGGEYRIPVLVFLFGLGIKVAGTTSQLVSLPTILVALWKHGRMGFVTRGGLRIAAAMGAGSVVGAVIGTVILVSTSGRIVELVFALLLLYTIVRLTWELLKQ